MGNLFVILYRYRYIWIHLAVVICAWFIFSFFGLIRATPNAENTLHWDASWYQSIANDGYSYQPSDKNNLGFFPLFAYFWQITSLGPLGISVLNGLFFLLSFAWLITAFNIRQEVALLFLSFPAFVHFYVPYSEALFFLFATMVLVGYQKQTRWLTVIGLALAGLTGPVSLFFLPAILLAEVIGGKSMKAMVQHSVLYVIAITVGLFAVFLIQWYQTGEWWLYFQTLITHWGFYPKWPSFPLTTWDGARLMWIDGLALWVGLAAAVTIVAMKLRWLRRRSQEAAFSKAAIFSATVLGLSALYIVFFSVKNDTGSTSILSANRYIFATPFFVVIALDLIKNFTPTRKSLLLLVGGSAILWLLMGAYQPLPGGFYGLGMAGTVACFSIMTGYILLYAFLNHTKMPRKLVIGLYCTNTLLQAYLYNMYLQGSFIG